MSQKFTTYVENLKAAKEVSSLLGGHPFRKKVEQANELIVLWTRDGNSLLSNATLTVCLQSNNGTSVYGSKTFDWPSFGEYDDGAVGRAHKAGWDFYQKLLAEYGDAFDLRH